MGLKASSQQPPVVILRQDRPTQEPFDADGLVAVAVTLLLTALISWVAARYLNWAMAPRRFRLRVGFAGALPVGILAGVIVAAGLAQGRSLATAIAGLVNAPLVGKFLLLAMLLTGLCVAWATARRRDRRDAVRGKAMIETFE